MDPDLDSRTDDLRLSDADARRLLERAIALDAARAGETTIAELRRVAQELNVSPLAFGEALRELENRSMVPASPAPLPEPVAAAAPDASRKRNWWRPLAIGLSSFMLGVIEARATSRPDLSIALVLFAAVALILKHRRSHTPAEFQADLFALFAPMGLIWLMATGNPENIFAAAFGWLATSTIGGFLVRWKMPWQKAPPDKKTTLAVALVALSVGAGALNAQVTPTPPPAPRITTPKEELGYNFGDDYFLANYQQLAEYWRKLDMESDRMVLREIGKTAEGRPHLMAIVTSPENHKNLEKYQDISRKLALAEGLTDEQARALAKEGKTVVWIDGGLHASETLGAQQLGEMIYQMVSGTDEETLRILNDVIILFVHANPDGNDLVADWYMRRDVPQQRSTAGLPRLYQKYIGHDNNRDFFASTQAETENMNRVLYHDWLPQLLYNHHQSGPAGTVVWSPPLRDPYNYNLHPMLVLGFQSLGAAMHTRLAAENKPGATMRSGGPYDGWWNGGIRNTAAFHNVIALLTEMIGSPTPMRIPFVADRQIPKADLAFPIMPQEWHFRQSVDYSVSLNRAVLDYASRMRENLLYNIYVMGKSSIERGSRDYWTPNPRRIADVALKASGNGANGRGAGSGRGAGAADATEILNDLRKPEERDPRAFIIPSNQPDFATATRFINALREVNITVHRATSDFDEGGKRYPVGSFVVFSAQAFRPHVMDMFEPQVHPDIIPYPGAPPTPPYDNAGWSLALQMGVQFDRILQDSTLKRPTGPFEKVTDWNLPMPAGRVTSVNNARGYTTSRLNNNVFIALNRLQKANEEVFVITQPLSANGQTYPPGTLYVRAGRTTRALLDRLAKEVGVSFDGVSAPMPATRVRPARVGLWDQYGGSIDAGWARWILEQFEFPFTRVFAPDLDAGNLKEKYDVLVFVSGAIPNPNPNPGRGGGGGGGGGGQQALTDIPAEYQAQLGSVTTDKTVPQIEQFVRAGGTVIAIGESAVNLATFLKLPVEDHLVENGTALPRTRFFVPGSVLSARVDTHQAVTRGMTEYTNVFFDDSPVLKLGSNAADAGVTPLAWFDSRTPLRSGWALGQEHLENGVIAAEARVGLGRVLLFTPEILKRAQPHPTFKFLFNGIITAVR